MFGSLKKVQYCTTVRYSAKLCNFFDIFIVFSAFLAVENRWSILYEANLLNGSCLDVIKMYISNIKAGARVNCIV